MDLPTKLQSPRSSSVSCQKRRLKAFWTISIFQISIVATRTAKCSAQCHYMTSSFALYLLHTHRGKQGILRCNEVASLHNTEISPLQIDALRPGAVPSIQMLTQRHTSRIGHQSRECLGLFVPLTCTLSFGFFQPDLQHYQHVLFYGTYWS